MEDEEGQGDPAGDEGGRRSATNPKTRTTTATMVSARVARPALVDRWAADTSSGFALRRNRIRCEATGATTITVETTASESATRKTTAQRWLELAEALLERHREEEAGEDLQAGLGDAQLLEELVPIPVGALGGGLVALRPVRVVRVAVVLAAVVLVGHDAAPLVCWEGSLPRTVRCGIP